MVHNIFMYFRTRYKMTCQKNKKGKIKLSKEYNFGVYSEYCKIYLLLRFKNFEKRFGLK